MVGAAEAGFELVSSELVLDEASRGDPEAARDRLAFVEGMAVLRVTSEAEDLAHAILAKGVLGFDYHVFCERLRERERRSQRLVEPPPRLPKREEAGGSEPPVHSGSRR